MSEDQESSSPNFFMIGDKKYQIQNGSLADEKGDLVLHFGDKVPIQIKQKIQLLINLKCLWNVVQKIHGQRVQDG